MSEGSAPRYNQEGLDWESTLDLTAVPEEDLATMLEQLVDEEKEISYRRRILQGRIDLIRAEILSRGNASLSPEELARVLMDRGGE